MASKLKNLPPDVRRELLRHVKPRSSTASASSTTVSSRNNRNNNLWPLVAGCTALIGLGTSLPYWASQTIGNLTDREDALTAAQTRRGAFLNSGTQDAGKDPNWDWKNGTYVYPKGFAEHLKRQNPNDTDLGPDLGPMIQEQNKEKQRR